MKQVVLLMTHFYNQSILEKYKKMRRELDDSVYDVVLLFNDEYGVEIGELKKCKLFKFSVSDLNILGYEPIEETIIPGSVYFAVLYFYKMYPCYTYYWFIEYDVAFTGKWSRLFNAFESCHADFLSSHIEHFNRLSNGTWTWWYRGLNIDLPIDKCVKSFNPICRYSKNALECLDKHLASGLCGHQEVVVPTILNREQMILCDFGGIGDFVQDGFANKFYIQLPGVHMGSLRYRPVFCEQDILLHGIENKIYHPVKF